MSITNSFFAIVKILETPKQYRINDRNTITIVRGELSQKRHTKILLLVFWNRIGHDVKNFYKKNDYALIEGYLSSRDQKKVKSKRVPSRKIIITVLRISPILFNKIK